MTTAARGSIVVCLLAAGIASAVANAWAQAPGQLELSSAVQLDEVDAAVRAHLQRAGAYIDNRQWPEAIETFRLLMENYGGKVIAVAPRRYIRLANYCQLQIASLPTAALELYRESVDPEAERLYSDAMARRDRAALARIVGDMYCSTWGDDALLALGDIALEQGQPSVARSYWEQIIERPPERVPEAVFRGAIDAADIDPLDRAAVKRWYETDKSSRTAGYRLKHDEPMPDDAAERLTRFWKAARLPATRLAYPSSALNPADVRARLVLASIFEGSLPRAKSELEALERLHPEAEGALAGRHEPYAKALAQLLTEAEGWPSEPVSDDWSTFAGNPARNKIARDAIDVGAPLWPAIPLGTPLTADANNSQRFSSYRVGERGDGLLGYHPLIVGDTVLVSTGRQILAFNLETGKPQWSGSPQQPPGEIYRDAGSPAAERSGRGLGVPRFTMTAHEGRLYARVGSQVTSRPVDYIEGPSGRLVCLDLAAEGRLVWQITPDDQRWAFEGAPVVAGTDLYVAMRHSDVRPQVHVACFDAETGVRRWRTMICAAETPAGGQMDELTHNLVTLDEGTIYINTNLGAVGAVSAFDGHLLWISTYPRAKRLSTAGGDKRVAHFYRDLNPCVYHQGTVLVAPADSEMILALDAGSGQPMWETALAADTVHLLGVGEGNLIASGDHLWWIDASTGKIRARWPDQSPHGYGRGILAGDRIFWPTRDTLYVFRQAVGPNGQVSLARTPVPLIQERAAGGGNLVISRGALIIAAADKLYGLSGQAGRATVTAASVESRPPAAPNRRIFRP
jgi:outer membrane protein assembly factor BamB